MIKGERICRLSCTEADMLGFIDRTAFCESKRKFSNVTADRVKVRNRLGYPQTVTGPVAQGLI